jgi:hypothetical protein
MFIRSGTSEKYLASKPVFIRFAAPWTVQPSLAVLQESIFYGVFNLFSKNTGGLKKRCRTLELDPAVNASCCIARYIVSVAQLQPKSLVSFRGILVQTGGNTVGIKAGLKLRQPPHAPLGAEGEEHGLYDRAPSGCAARIDDRLASRDRRSIRRLYAAASLSIT